MRIVRDVTPTFVVVIAGRRKRFHTEGAAYYAHVKAQLGAKYLAAIEVCETHERNEASGAGGSKSPTDVELRRYERAVEMFYTPATYDSPSHFDPKRWTEYVRRCVTKMRAMDGRIPKPPPAPYEERDVDDTVAELHDLGARAARACARGHELWRSDITDEQRANLRTGFRALRKAVR